MKRRPLFFVMLVAMLVLLPVRRRRGGSTTRRVGGTISPGQTKLPDYKAIIEGLTKSWQFENYTLTFEESSEYLTVDADGTVHISADTPVNTRIKMTVYLKPVKSGVSKQTVHLTLFVQAPIEDFRFEPDTIYLMENTDAQQRFHLNGVPTMGYIEQIVTSGAELVKVTSAGLYDDYLRWRVQPANSGTGVYETTYYAYDGQEATLRVHVLPYATKLEFAEKQVSCVLGDTIPLNIDMGVGANGYAAASSVIRFEMYEGKDSLSSVAGVWIDTGDGMFKALRHGRYRVVASLGTMSDTMYVSIYDDAACQSITVNGGNALYSDQADVLVKCLDASGNEIVRPLRIVDGADIAALDRDHLTFSGTGKFTLEAQNPDGSTCTQTFEVSEPPTAMTLNAVELTLDIGKGFTLKASFDKGEHPYEVHLGYNTDVNEENLAPGG